MRRHLVQIVLPGKAEVQDHVENVFVKGVIKIVVKVSLCDQLKHFLMMLPVFENVFVVLILWFVRKLVQQVQAVLHNVEEDQNERKAVISLGFWTILAHVHQVVEENVLSGHALIELFLR